MTGESVDERMAAVVEVLTAHEYVAGHRRSCACGFWERPDPDAGLSLQEVHRAHVALALLASPALAPAEPTDPVRGDSMTGESVDVEALRVAPGRPQGGFKSEAGRAAYWRMSWEAAIGALADLIAEHTEVSDALAAATARAEAAEAERDRLRAGVEAVYALIGGPKQLVFLGDRPNRIVRVQQRRDDLGVTVTTSMVAEADIRAALLATGGAE